MSFKTLELEKLFANPLTVAIVITLCILTLTVALTDRNAMAAKVDKNTASFHAIELKLSEIQGEQKLTNQRLESLQKQLEDNGRK